MGNSDYCSELPIFTELMLVNVPSVFPNTFIAANVVFVIEVEAF